MRGSLLLLFGSAAVYLVAALAIGLWISSIVDTQQQAMFVTFFIMNVYLLMSGLFTPIDSMAPWVRAVSQFNPVRHFVTISRAILMKGAGLADIAQPLLMLDGVRRSDAGAGDPPVFEARCPKPRGHENGKDARKGVLSKTIVFVRPSCSCLRG